MMALPLTSNWMDWDAACSAMVRASGRSQRGQEMEPLLIATLGEGFVRSRRVNVHTHQATELDATFWRDGGARMRMLEADAVEVHHKDLLDWLNPTPSPIEGRKRGRREVYDWEDMWIEVVKLANHPDGLPEKQAALVDHLETWFEDKIGKSPARSGIEERISRLYNAVKPDN